MSRDEAGSCVWGSVHVMGLFWGRMWVASCNQWGVCGIVVRKFVNHQSCSFGGSW